MDDCPWCGEPLDPDEADGKFDPKRVVHSDGEEPSYHLGCEDGVFREGAVTVFGPLVASHLHQEVRLFDLLMEAGKGDPDPDYESHRPETLDELISALMGIRSEHGGDVRVRDEETGAGVFLCFLRGEVYI